MSIDWNTFTPWSALVGGLLIGLATALYLLGNGRVAGITGIVASPLLAVFRRTGLQPEMTRLMFLLGLFAAPWLWGLCAPLPLASVDVGPGLLIVAGMLVGVGVRMGNGCTSGHGVCGLSRFSLRSLVNVLCFMLSGAFSVWVVRHWL